MLVPIPRRTAPSSNSHNGSKCIAALAIASDLFSLCCCGASVIKACCVAIAVSFRLRSLPSARQVAVPFTASIAAQVSHVVRIIVITALEYFLDILKNSFTNPVDRRAP